MSSVTLSAIRSGSSLRSSVPAPTDRGGRLRITRRGRVVLTLLVAVPLVIVIALAVLNGGRAAAGDGSSSRSVHFETVTIEPGESLWQLAEQKAPSADPREFIQDVVTLNDLQTSVVQAGQQIAIPTQYTSAN